jgi:hypothetical protein
MNAHRILSVLVASLFATSAFAQVPQLLNYQGRVVVGTTNFDGAGLFKFALVNSNGTVSFWSNDGTSAGGSQPTASINLPVVRGLYSILLGDTTIGGMPTVLPATVFTNFDVRLRVWFNDGVTGFQQFTPDQRIAAVGYALMGANVPDGAITSNKIANGAVVSSKLADNAVTPGKIAGGAIFATNIANNGVTSNQLADAISLGAGGVLGQLDVYSTAAGTPAVSLIGGISRISTFGGDGLEQIRLHGVSWGEILLNDNTGNDTTVNLSANTDGGGSLTLLHSNGSSRALLSASTISGELSLYGTNGVLRTRLHGGTDGSFMTLYAADGSSGVVVDGDDIGGGSISVRNTNSSNRVFIDGLGAGGGGQIILYANDGSAAANLLGDSGGAGFLSLLNTNGLTRAALDGLGSAGGGQLTLYANDGSVAVNLFGEASTGSHGGELSVNGPSATEGAQIVGETYGGRMTTFDETGLTTLLLGSSVASGGFAQFYQADGDLGVIVDGDNIGSGYISVYGTNGLANIIINGNSSGDGRITCDVLQINGGSDLSERFDITTLHAPIKPGMIVSINPEKPGDLVVSAKAYDRTVAGIISGAGGVKPGMLMGQTGTKADGQHPVALTGRVYCYVDADAGGAIEPGDMITTSSTPGHGMKVTEHSKASGAIIGKAMSKLASGKGLVLVLVSLQ